MAAANAAAESAATGAAAKRATSAVAHRATETGRCPTTVVVARGVLPGSGLAVAVVYVTKTARAVVTAKRASSVLEAAAGIAVKRPALSGVGVRVAAIESSVIVPDSVVGSGASECTSFLIPAGSKLALVLTGLSSAEAAIAKGAVIAEAMRIGVVGSSGP